MLRTLNHVYAMDDVWRAHLDGRAHGYTTRNPEACPPLADLGDQQRAMDAWFGGYADSLTDAKQAEVVNFRFIGRRIRSADASGHPAACGQPWDVPPRQRGGDDVSGGRGAADYRPAGVSQEPFARVINTRRSNK